MTLVDSGPAGEMVHEVNKAYAVFLTSSPNEVFRAKCDRVRAALVSELGTLPATQEVALNIVVTPVSTQISVKLVI